MKGIFISAALASAALPSVVSAETAVSNIVGGSIGYSEFTRGFAFSLNSAVTVTGLGYYDENGDGFAADHQVGIFDSAGTLLVSGTATSANTLAGGFRYTNTLTGSAVLAAGSYFVGGLSNIDDGNLRAAASATFGPNLTYLGSTDNGATVFSAPTNLTPGFDVGYFGANFTYNVGAVPEPASWAMMIAGFGLAGAAMRRRPTMAAAA